jgi:putative membrane protein
MLRHLSAAAAATAMLGACAMMDTGEPGATTMAADMSPEERTAYVAMAASSDMYEIQSSQLAMSRSQNGSIRNFAQMMVQHHTQTSQQLMAAAQASGTPMPAGMMPMHARMLQELQGANGMAFDRMYRTQQVMAHQQALALHSNYAARGDNATLRSVAATATPIVRGHLDQARQLR